MLVLIGNSPSSGSTLLADLLDSTIYSACGPELGLFASKNFFLHSDIRIKKGSIGASVYCEESGLIVDNLPAYGFDIVKFQSFVSENKNKEEFVSQFCNRFLGLRGKSPQGIVFEKTPQNIGQINAYFDTFPEGRFVSILRHPADVLRSLRKRGFSNYIALATWMIDVAMWYRFKDDPRVTSIKYEELVDNPFESVRDIIQGLIDVQLKPDEIRNGYENNVYRRYFEERMITWKNKEVGEVVKKERKVNYSAEHLKVLGAVRISNQYADKFNLPAINFLEIVEELGYLEFASDFGDESLGKTPDDAKKLFRRWLKSYVKEDAKLSEITCYLNPLVF